MNVQNFHIDVTAAKWSLLNQRSDSDGDTRLI